MTTRNTEPAKPRKGIKRSATTKRGTPSLQRGGKPKAKKRTPEATERIYGPPQFREWLHNQPCILCGIEGYTQQCHAQTGGKGRKDDWTRTFPACGPHPVWREAMHAPERTLDEGCHKRQPAKAERLALAAATYARFIAEFPRFGEAS